MDDASKLPLADIFRRLIRNTGPISLTQFMGESNTRYYTSRDPLGQAGDFVTAPEISQMFGELIGLWMADIWIRAGRDEPVYYVELGPGRGTLAKDALRAASRYGFTPNVHFVETSQALKNLQLSSVPGASWHDDLSSIPMDGPILLIGNEFLDALPVRQLVKLEQGWRERMVGLSDDGNFTFVAGGQSMDAAIQASSDEYETGTILETSPAAAAILFEVCGRLQEQDGAALFIDYGYSTTQTGSTLQAVRNHSKVDPLSYPGEADLTALVDFATLIRVAETRDIKHMGTIPQGQWLKSLGMEARAEKLAASAPRHAQEIEIAKQRLIAEDQMGVLFKVMGLASPNWPDGIGFES